MNVRFNFTQKYAIIKKYIYYIIYILLQTALFYKIMFMIIIMFEKYWTCDVFYIIIGIYYTYVHMFIYCNILAATAE